MSARQVFGAGRRGWVCGRMAAMTELVHYAVADAVATITLDSPHNRNALSRQLVTELFGHSSGPGPTTTSGSC